jgi:hypothetical protein
MATRVLERVSSPAAAPVEGLAQRIRSEFEEMPCLRLTLPQASRFWTVDRETCRTALDQLVSEGILVNGRFGYMRA